jgi:hypothetical protein
MALGEAEVVPADPAIKVAGKKAAEVLVYLAKAQMAVVEHFFPEGAVVAAVATMAASELVALEVHMGAEVAVHMI